MAQVVSLSKTNGIRHVRTAPYHPASNGLAERSMRIFKGGMKKLKDRTLEIKLAHFLFSYRLTPQTTTGLSPSELLFGHRLCCHLDFLHPNFPAKCQSRQKILMTIMLETDIYKLETRDFARNYGTGEPWLPGVMQSETGPSPFLVDLTDGRRVRRHLDQVRKDVTTADVSDSTAVTGTTDDDFLIPIPD